MSETVKRPLGLQIAEAVSLAICPILFGGAVLLSGNALWLRDQGWLLLVLLVLGWACADILSGLVHWGCDRYGSITTPLIGKHFIGPFREHHVDPKAMTRHDMLETNGNTAMLGCVAGGGLLATVWWGQVESVFGNAMILWLAWSGSWSLPANQVHKWAHMDRAPALIRLLQKLRIVLPPRQHSIHHRPPHLVHYCIAHGNLNGLLDRIGFFQGIEKTLALMGFHPAVQDEPEPHSGNEQTRLERIA